MEHDYLNTPRRPSNDPIRDQIRDESWRSQGAGWFWPMLALAILLFVGLFLVGNLGSDQPNTQVTQNVKRPGATPPNATAPNTTPPTRSPTQQP